MRDLDDTNSFGLAVEEETKGLIAFPPMFSFSLFVDPEEG